MKKEKWQSKDEPNFEVSMGPVWHTSSTRNRNKRNTSVHCLSPVNKRNIRVCRLLTVNKRNTYAHCLSTAKQTAFICQLLTNVIGVFTVCRLSTNCCQLSTNEIHVLTACQLSTLLPFKKLIITKFTVKNTYNNTENLR